MRMSVPAVVPCLQQGAFRELIVEHGLSTMQSSQEKPGARSRAKPVGLSAVLLALEVPWARRFVTLNWLGAPLGAASDGSDAVVACSPAQKDP